MSTETTGDKFYFNVRTRKVEQGTLSPAKDRLGPYDTHAEATLALERARSRSVAWDEEDEAKDEWGVAPGGNPQSGGAATGIDLDEVADGRES
ncbi:MAG: SPOR domain-containing protein [Actinomycetota bacterium]|nr:SPOR domain-containing protein [Actinomycetota bacterium]